MTLEKRVRIIILSVGIEAHGEELCYYVSIFVTVNCLSHT
jgi:hypothetical protein